MGHRDPRHRLEWDKLLENYAGDVERAQRESASVPWSRSARVGTSKATDLCSISSMRCQVSIACTLDAECPEQGVDVLLATAKVVFRS